MGSILLLLTLHTAIITTEAPGTLLHKIGHLIQPILKIILEDYHIKMPAKWMEILAGIPRTAPQSSDASATTHVANNGNRPARVVVMHGDGRQNLVTLAQNTSRSFKTAATENITVALLDDAGEDIVEMRTVAGGINLILQKAPPKENTALQLLCAKSDQFWEVDHDDFSRKKEHKQKDTEENNTS